MRRHQPLPIEVPGGAAANGVALAAPFPTPDVTQANAELVHTVKRTRIRN